MKQISPLTHIIIKGAREHNLKNINLSFPKNQLVLFTGISGSGKSSLAFDTLFAEGQRRYIESLSSYARQFLGSFRRPQVDLIEGLTPTIAINQKTISHNPRSTVGTVTEIYDYLRLLFARLGRPSCPSCGRQVSPQTSRQIVDQILTQARQYISGLTTFRFLVLSPLIANQKGDFRGLLSNLRQQGFKYIRIDNQITDLYSDFSPVKTNKHTIEAVIDRLSITKNQLKNPRSLSDRLLDSVNQALEISSGQVIISQVLDASFDFPQNPQNIKDTLYSQNYACPVCNISLPALEPSLFSFNSPQGACPVCNGLGFNYQIDSTKFPKWKANILTHRFFNTESEFVRQEIQKYMTKKICSACQGARLSPQSLAVHLQDKNIYQVSQLSIFQLYSWLKQLPSQISLQEKKVFNPIYQEISTRLQFLLSVGLDYLSLDREAGSLSNGESQRIRLASQIGTGLTGVLYILDEPTIGLHPRDNQRLIATLKKLKSLGNTVLIVEHDRHLIESADYIVDFGPYAGRQGGQIVAQGTPAQIKSQPQSLTGQFLNGKLKIKTNSRPRFSASQQFITLRGCSQWNLKNITAKFPLNSFVCVTGVSGSGKSTLVHQTLYAALKDKLYGSFHDFIGKYQSVEGWRSLSRLLLVDQSPIGRTPRSNPATYTNVLGPIRQLLAQTTEAKIRGYTPAHFSFNTKSGGRCQACRGQGRLKVEMQFLPDVYVTCQECNGSRFQSQILEVDFKGKNIAQILSLTIDQAIDFFSNQPQIKSKLITIQQVGLGYLQLGQPSPTLSGGESQRLKISRELVKTNQGHTLYILDEPTTGLHLYDVAKLIKVLRQLVDQGNTVVVIEHHLEVIKNSDWIIDLGPGGGDRGGEIVFQGPTSQITSVADSSTAQFLKLHLRGGF